MAGFYLIWMRDLRGPSPQIVRAEKGQLALSKDQQNMVLARHELNEVELGMPLEQLCQKYPAPAFNPL